MTTTWQILDTKYQTADGLITTVTYNCMVQLEEHIDRKIGEITLTGDVSAEGFISYPNLTEEAIVGWVKNILGETEITSIETTLQNNVTARKVIKDTQITKQGLPWRK
jgi:hypothetical protein